MTTVVTAARRALLPFVAACLTVGALAWKVSDRSYAEIVWALAAAIVALDLVAVTIARLREGRIAVDLVALVALVVSIHQGEPLAGAILALMVASGDALEQYAHRRARRSLSSLLSLAPKMAHRRDDGRFESIAAEDVAAGDVLMVKPGEVLPVDGKALQKATVDESALTGESHAVERDIGERLQSGSINAGSAFEMQAEATAADSAYSGIVSLVRSAGVEKSPFVRLADRYALFFVPVVFAAAGGAWLISGDSIRALAVLVIATPCPLVLAAPVAIVSGISGAARAGVVVKDGAALEAMGQTRTVLLDKTGTLTAGRAHVVAVICGPGWDAQEVLSLAASVEQASPHVLATTIVREARTRGLDLAESTDVEERPGSGVKGIVDGHDVWVGAMPSNTKAESAWVASALRRARREGCSTMVVLVDDEPAGMILFTDELRVDAPRALRALRRAGVTKVAMVTGDRLEVAEPIGTAIGLDQIFADRTPAEKLEIVRREALANEGTTVMVGDGVNDAPALAAADLGVAMGARGATASSEAADVVLIVDRLDCLATGVHIAKHSRKIAHQSVLLGMTLSFIGMGFAAVGLLSPVAGALAQEIIDVLAISNALRALRPPDTLPTLRAVPDAWRQQLETGHAALRLVLEDIRTLAMVLDEAQPTASLSTLTDLSDRIARDIVSHEQTDETDIYPQIAEHMSGDDPLASMSRTHQEIFRLASLLQRLTTDASSGNFDAADLAEARRLLFALDAILRLHFAQEEELLHGLTAHKAG